MLDDRPFENGEVVFEADEGRAAFGNPHATAAAIAAMLRGYGMFTVRPSLR